MRAFKSTSLRADAPARPTLLEAAAPAADSAAVLQCLYDAHATKIYRQIYRRVGNREDAEDLTAQVFMKALQSLDSTRDEASQVAWLYQVVRTTIVDHWRAYYPAQGHAASLDALQEAYGYESPAAIITSPTPEDDDLADRRVASVLSALPENYRRVLTLRFLEGYSLKETAAALHVSEGNVKVLQHRALQKASTLRLL